MIDERPDEIKQLEAFGTDKWKVIGGKTFCMLLVLVLASVCLCIFVHLSVLLSVNKQSSPFGFNRTKCIMNYKIIKNSVFIHFRSEFGLDEDL